MQVTALHVAAGAGQPLTLYRLITCRAVDVNLTDTWGLTPLDYAVRAEHWPCATLLLSNAGMQAEDVALQPNNDNVLRI